MNAPSESAIRQAIDSIDQWVLRKPPAAYYGRVYELAWDQDTTGENAIDIFEQDPAFASFLEHFVEYRILSVVSGSESDARKFDAAYFEAVRKKLLVEPLEVLQSLLTPALSPELKCRALTALLYGNVQNLLWRLHVNQTASVPPRVIFERGTGAEYALRQLLNLESLSRELLQAYADRWQIEVNHREEKDTLGVGQAQLRSARSVPRQPAFAVAAYSALLLAGLLAYGPTRDSRYLPLPTWHRTADRPSCLDLIALLRKEMVENSSLLSLFGFKLAWKSLALPAAA